MLKPAETEKYLTRILGPASVHGDELSWYCPFCLKVLGSESRKKKFNYNVLKNKGFCFRCESKVGSVVQLLMRLHGNLTAADWEFLRGGQVAKSSHELRDAIQKLRETPEGPRALLPVALPPEYRPLLEHRAGIYGRVWRYLLGRGVGEDEVRRFSIGYALTGRYAGYLIFPITQEGVVVYFSTRYVGKSEIKSLNPKYEAGTFSKATVLFNHDAVVGKKSVAVTEGPFDCISTPNSVALLGKVLSPCQFVLFDRLARWGTHEFVVCLDADADATGIARTLSAIRPVRVAKIPRDPNDDREQMPELLLSARPLSLRSTVSRRRTQITHASCPR